MKRTIIVFFVCFLFLLNPMKASAFSEAAKEVLITSEDTVLAKQVMPLLTALKNRDRAAMYDLFVFKTIEKSTDDFFESLFTAWDGREFTSAEWIRETRRDAQGKKPMGTTYQYRVAANTDIVILEFTVSDKDNKIDQIRIMEEITVAPQRHLLILIALGTVAIAEIIFTLYNVFMCVRRKPKFWILWILFILTCYGGAAIIMKEGFVVSFFVQILEFSKISFKGNIISEISISVPIGAIVYWIKFKNVEF